MYFDFQLSDYYCDMCFFLCNSPAPSLAKSPSSGSSASGNTEDAAKQRVKVNDSAPTTNLQVRLADGSRLDSLFMEMNLCFMKFCL